MHYTQEQIDRANAVSLEDFLRSQGETLIKSGREYRWKEHDSLTVRDDLHRLWKVKSCVDTAARFNERTEEQMHQNRPQTRHKKEELSR